MLHDATKQRILELFKGQHCIRCRQPAQRFWRHRYFCQACFPGTRTSPVRLHRTSANGIA